MLSFPKTWPDRDTGEVGRFAHDWHYYPEQGGTPYGAVVRYQTPTGRKLVIPFFATDDDGRPRAKAPDEPRPLFGLNLLKRSGPLFVCEGEKDCAALHWLGLSAVTSQGGSKAVEKADWEPVSRAADAGRPILAWPDHDAPGRQYAARVAHLIGAGCQCLLTPPAGTPDTDGAGAADWLLEQMRRLGIAWDGFNRPPLGEDDRRRLREQLLTAVEGIQGPPPDDWGGRLEKKNGTRHRGLDATPLPYAMNERGTFRLTRSPSGDPIEQQLANFTARIVQEITRDDGQDRAFTLLLQGRMHQRDLPEVLLPIEQFNRMDWPTRHWGTAALTHPGQGAKDHLKYAIQALSHQGQSSVTIRTTFTHTGWRKIGGDWRYLSAGAVIGAEGAVAGIEVDLGELGALYSLPPPSTTAAERREAAAASLAVRAVAPPEVTVPLLACTYLAAVAQRIGVDFTLWLEGPSRTKKSTLAALAAAHFGAGAERTNLAASWLDTSNAIGIKLFMLADALAVIDDYAPQPSAGDQAKLEKTVANVVRSIGNRTGRGRLRQDLSLQTERRPRAMVLSTAEQWPSGESINARLFGVPLRPGMVNLQQLNQAQAAAQAGLLARAMGDLIRGLADGHDERCDDLRAGWREHRDTALQRGLSGRTPEQAAFLLVGYGLAVDHWTKAGAISMEQAGEQLAQAREIIFELARQHERRIAHSQPAVAFVTILADLLRAGTAHLLDTSESRSPVNAPAYGWKPDPHGQLQPLGDHLGWVDEAKRELYLIPTVALKAVLSAARHLDAPLNLKESALKRQLLECGFLLPGEVKQRGDSSVQRLTRQVRVGNSRSYVLVMPLDIIEQLERAE